MPTTRHQAKVADASDGADHGETSTHIALPEDLQLDTLYDLLPDADLSCPTPSDILALYRLCAGQATDLNALQRDVEAAQAEAEKKDVELDQALQDSERRSRDQESQTESLQADLEKVRKERDHLAASNKELTEDIARLTNSQTTTSGAVEEANRRVQDVEREKRDLVGVTSRLQEENTQREEELTTLRHNLKEARQDHQSLESQVRELRSAQASTKFRIDSLTQQLQLSQSEVQRLNEELNTKAEEFTKYRRTKQTDTATLQANLDEATSNYETTRATLKALQTAHASQGHEYNQALAKVQDLTGQLAEQESAFASEAGTLKRLVSVLEEREKEARDIVENIEKEWTGVGDRADQRETALREEAEREKKARLEAEKKLDQLEAVLDKMGRGELPVPGRSGLGTPGRNGVTDEMTDGMMGLSPTVAIASKAQRSGKTFTEVYADYVQLQEDYARKSAEYDHMDRTLAAVLAQIEERAPILSQQRVEYERLQSEAAQLASQLSQALFDRDAQTTQASQNAQQFTKAQRQNELLEQQVTDLGRQVQSLLKELSRRDDPSIPDDEELQDVPVASNVDSVITNHLVAYKSISHLQEQNQRLLKITRELSAKMESEEREYREVMEREQGEAVKEAHEAIQDLAAQLERQKSTSEGIIQAYVKERDTLKGMLARQEKVNGFLSDNNNTTRSESTPQTMVSRDMAEIQTHFDTYRLEMGVDANRLREENIAAQREVGQLNATLAKANAKIEYLTERSRMSQEQISLHSREMEELTKRNQQLFDQWTRLDIQCNRVTDDLQDANGRMEQLRNENANMRAEKKIWESVQSRLVEENRILSVERSHLSDLMVNVQKMHNDLETAGENDRKRLESQLQLLEGQTQDLRLQLTTERDTIRQMSLQKDHEIKELHDRADRQSQDLLRAREGLVGAETSRKHYEDRVADLTKELEGLKQKVSVYETRPASSTSNGDISSHRSTESGAMDLKAYEAECASLKSMLKIAEIDLNSARQHVQQFREISEANETALAGLNSTHEAYKVSMEAEVARHESEFKAIQEKLEATKQEMSQIQSKYTELQKSSEVDRKAWADDKKLLEGTIFELTTSERQGESDRTSREGEVRQQEERAKAAEERYTNEVVAHAESIKSVETLKQELAAVRTYVRDAKTEAETATSKLHASEVSWQQQKSALEKELTDQSARCKDLSAQNTLLHQHLESVSSQAARIRQAAGPSTSSVEESAVEGSDAQFTELQKVLSYVRKEKEVVELQLDLCKQENLRLKTQLEHANQSLEQTRNILSDERERAVESAASATQHAELVERINQLNILRESNATLRADCEAQTRKARDLEAKLKEVSAELEPAREKARMATAEIEARDAQMKRLEDESRRWQERNTQLLTKYDRIDPAEVQALRDEIQKLKEEKAEIENRASQSSVNTSEQATRIEALEAQVKKLQDLGRRNNEVAKRKFEAKDTDIKTGLEKISELEATVSTLQAQNLELTDAKASLEAEALIQTSVPSTTSGDLDALKAEKEQLVAERDQLLAEKATWAEKPSTASDTANSGEVSISDAERAELAQARDTAQAQVKRVTDQFQKTLQELREKGLRVQALEDQVSKLSAASKANSGGSSTEEVAKKHAEELKALEERLTTQHEEDKKKALAAVGGAPPSGDQQAAIDAALAEQDKKFQETLAEEKSKAMESQRHESQMKGRIKDQQLARSQARLKEYEKQVEIWVAEGKVTAPTWLSTPPTPAKPAAKAAVPQAGPSTPTPATAPATSSANGATKPAVPPVGAKAGTIPAKPVGTAASVRGGRGGLAATRGAATRGRGGGPIHAAAAAAAANNKPAAGGVSIQGAAKRPREEAAGAPGDDASLAKRLKPAPAGGPVQIKRPAGPGPAT